MKPALNDYEIEILLDLDNGTFRLFGVVSGGSLGRLKKLGYITLSGELTPHGRAVVTAYRAGQQSPAAPEVVPFSVDPRLWEVLNFAMKWIAADKNGEVWTAAKEPDKDEKYSHWVSEDDKFFCDITHLFPGLILRGTCDWRKAIVQRPKGTQHD